jgi:uncharacterized protein YukE
MTDGPVEFWDLVQQVDELAEKTIDDIVAAADKIVDMLNDAVNSIGGFLEWANPFDDNTIEQAVDKWNNEICPALEQGIVDIREKVGKAVDSLAGAPLDLQEYSEAFVNAKTKLYKQGSIAQKLTTLGQSWEGDAYDVYNIVATEQDAALLNLSKSLESGATNTIQAANEILQCWRTLVHEFGSFQTDIINLLASATDASKVISFEVPVILEAIAVVWQKVIDIADVLAEFMINSATVDSLNWLMLSNGSDGLPENKWPVIEEASSDTMNDGGNWEVSA